MMKPVLQVLSFMAFAATPAQAMTFATGSGADNAGCGAVTAPCRTLQQAITNTPAGGYVVLQGPADFGPAAAIDKSISIVGEGGATIRANNAVDGRKPIFVAGSGDISKVVVRLRGLTIEGNGVGVTGVTWLGGARLEVADCVIGKFSDSGLFAQPYLPLSSTYRSFVSIIDTEVESADWGIWVRKPTGRHIGISAYVDGLRARRNRVGVQFWHDPSDLDGEVARTVLKNSATTENASSGLSGFVGVKEGSGAPPPGAGLFVVKSTTSGNASGVSSDMFTSVDGGISLSRSVVTGNASASTANTLVNSFGDNVIRGNADDTLNRFSLQSYH